MRIPEQAREDHARDSPTVDPQNKSEHVNDEI